MILIAFISGLIAGLMLVPSIARASHFIIKAQLKIFSRQCRIFYILRYKHKIK
jgi:hypothetical protein